MYWSLYSGFLLGLTCSRKDLEYIQEELPGHHGWSIRIFSLTDA